MEWFKDKLSKCSKCFNTPHNVFLGHGTARVPKEPAYILFAGESPSPNRTFNETFGMKSKPYFSAFKEEFLAVIDKPWWATNVAFCNKPELKLSGDPARCAQNFWTFVTLFARPSVIVFFGRRAARAAIGEKSVSPPGTVRRWQKYVVAFAHHPMAVHYGTISLTKYRAEARTIALQVRRLLCCTLLGFL